MLQDFGAIVMVIMIVKVETTVEMETRNIYSKKEQKSSSRHETEWDHQLPNRFLYRTSYVVKSSEVQKEIKVIKNHQPHLMSSNGEQNGQENEVHPNETKEDKTKSTQRSDQNSKTSSLSSLSSKSSTEKLKIFRYSSNISEPSAEKKRTAKDSEDSQLPEHSPNSHSCDLNYKAAMGESGLFIDPKSNFYSKRNSNLSSSKDYSPRKYSNDFSPLRIHSDIVTDTQGNGLAGGDYNKLPGIFSISDNDINTKKSAPPTEESVYSETSLQNDKFVNKSLHVKNEMFKDPDNIHLLDLKRNILINKESDSSSSKPFLCQDTNVKHSWMSNYSEVSDNHNDSHEFSELNFKQASNNQGETSPKEVFEFKKTTLKNCRTPNKNEGSKNNQEREINSDRYFILGNNKRILNNSQSSENSISSLNFNKTFNTEKIELSNDHHSAHKTMSSGIDFDLFRKSKYFLHQDSSDKISSVSSNLSENGESYQHSMNNFDSPMNNTNCKLVDNTGISLAYPTSDSHQDLKGVYIEIKQQVISRQESDGSEGDGSLGFDTQAQGSVTQSNEGSSLDIDTEHKSTTTSNTYHSGEDSDTSNISVRELIKYFEKFNLETEILQKKTKPELFAQMNLVYNGTEEINNLLDSNTNKRKLHMKKGCLKNDMYGNDYVNAFNERQCYFDNDCQDLLHYKEARQMEKFDPVDYHDKNKDDLMDYREYGFHHIDKRKEPASEHRVPKVDLLGFPTFEFNIPLLESQSLKLETEHPKESSALQTKDSKLQTKMANDLPRMKKLFRESSRDLHCGEEAAYSSKGFSDPDTSCDSSFKVHKVEPDERLHGPDITLEQAGEISVEKNKPLSDQRFSKMKKQNQLESNPLNISETRTDDQTSSTSFPFQKPEICDLHSESNSLHRLKVNRQILSLRGSEEDKLKPTSNESKTPVIINNISKGAAVPKQNSSDLNLENTLSKDTTNKYFKSCSWNSELVQKSAENDLSNSNQRTFFSMWKLMTLLIVLVVVVIDWNSLLKYIERR